MSSETNFYWEMPAGKRVYAGYAERLDVRLFTLVEDLGNDPAGLEKALADRILHAKRRQPGAEQLLYLVLCRTRGARSLVVGDVPDQELLDNPPSILNREPVAVQGWKRLTAKGWKRLTAKQRGREMLLLHLHQLLKLSEDDPDRQSKLRVCLELLPEYPG